MVCRALLTNENLMLLGASDIFALGDCATIYQPVLPLSSPKLYMK